jgi:ABC-type nitrate/sulfonate/bicarbonate transport system permease component
MTVSQTRPPVALGDAAAAPARPSGLRILLGKANVLTGFAILIVIWELAPRWGLIDREAFAPFSAVVRRLAHLATTSDFWLEVRSTLRTWAVGLAISTVGGVVLAALIAVIPGARRYTHSTIEFLRPIPSVALIPAVILVVGTKYESGVVLITYAALWPMLLQTLAGFDDIDAVARDTARSFRFPARLLATDVIWPSLLPYFFTGLRISASVALVLGVTGEMVIGTVGLGQGIAIAQSAGDTPTMYALVLVTGVLGVLINVVFRKIEKRSLRWHTSVRNLEAL